MRILISFLLLAITQSISTLPNEQLMKIAATEITLIMGSGIISELFYPSNAPKAINKTTQNNPTDPVAGDLFTGTAIGVLNIIISFYTCKKVHRYMPFCIFVASVYGHIAAAIATHHIKNFFIDLYKF